MKKVRFSTLERIYNLLLIETSDIFYDEPLIFKEEVNM